MRRILKWVGIVFGVLVGLIVVVAGVLYVLGSRNLNTTYAVGVETIAIPEDAESLARGQHLSAAISLCAECHGDDLGGKEFLDVPLIGGGDAPNLTPGDGGIGADYTVEDWIRALRHGVKQNGEAVLFMPSHYYYMLSDADLAAIIAYIRRVPPVNRQTQPLSLSPIGTILFGNVVELAYEQIDHDAERPVTPEIGVTVEYGDYLTSIGGCRECHGKRLDGDVPPGGPAGPKIVALNWTEQDFINTIRQGINPAGKMLDDEEMPWPFYTRMTDDELRAIWLYIDSLD